MKEVTVIELSEQTGLTRSQIYYLNKKHNLINLNEKINYEYALPIISTLTIKKAKRANEKNFRQILNMIILQNTALQKQLDLANECKETYLSELTSCQQSLAQKNTLIPSINQGNAQSALENNLNNIDENTRNLIQSENEICVPNESCKDSNTKLESTTMANIQTLPTQNKTPLPESSNRKIESSRQNNEAIEQKENISLDTPSPTLNSTPAIPKIRKKITTTATAEMLKSITVTKRKLNTNKQSEQAPENESIKDQDKAYKKDHHD